MRLPTSVNGMRALLYCVSLVVSSLLLCSCDETPPPPSQSTLETEVKAGSKEAAEILAKRTDAESVSSQEALGTWYEERGDLKSANHWWQISAKHGKAPLRVRTAPSRLYLIARGGGDDGEAGEGLLAFSRGEEAGKWQNLRGDDFELSDISEANRWWDLAEENGYTGPRNKHYWVPAWFCRHWLLVAVLLLAGWGIWRMQQQKGEDDDIQAPEPERPKERVFLPFPVYLSRTPSPEAKPVKISPCTR